MSAGGRYAMSSEAVPLITGTTRLFGVLGDPVAQVRAPGLMNAVMARAARDAVFVPMHVRRDEFDDVVPRLQRIGNLDGLLVTVPHKVEALRHGRPTQAALLSGGANALRREPDGSWVAENFDGAGFVAGLRGAGHDPVGWRVCVVGCGGAGSAIAAALLQAGAGQVALCDPDVVRVDAVTARLSAYWPGRVTGSVTPHLRDVELAVNATPLGLRETDPLPFVPGDLPPGAVVADIIMTPAHTRLLAEAQAAGRAAHPGLPMLTHQVDAYLEFFGL